MTPGTIPIGYLDPNNYFGYEMEAQQNNDGLCHWFIHHVVIPRTRGGGIPSSRLHPDGHPELVAMMNERTRFWILQGGRDWDYELLMYDNHCIVVPRSGRYALLQAAHTAAHQGLGRMQNLLEQSFYWPRMALDVRRYAQACQGVRRKGIAPPRPYRPTQTPGARSEQSADTLSRDRVSAESAGKSQPGELAEGRPEGETAPPNADQVDNGERITVGRTSDPRVLKASQHKENGPVTKPISNCRRRRELRRTVKSILTGLHRQGHLHTQEWLQQLN